MKRKAKSSQLAEVLQKEKGLSKGLVITFLTNLKIGQTLFLRYNLASKDTIANLTKVVDLFVSDKSDAEVEKVISKIEGQGFTLASSMQNFTKQLNPDQLIQLQSILTDSTGVNQLKKSVSHLLDHYEYTQ